MISGLFSAIQHNKPQVDVALEIASDQTVPDKCDIWSDHPRTKWPLIRPGCALSALEYFSFNGLLNEK